MAPKKAKKDAVERKQKVYLYLRVSTDKQDIEAQQMGMEPWLAAKNLVITDTFIDDGISGTVSWKERKIGIIINDMKAGDIIVVPELSRVGRVMSEVMTVCDLCVKAKVTLHAIKNNYVLDDSIGSKMMSFMLSLCCEMERDLLSKRTKQGMALARKNGKQIGRPFGFIYKDKILGPAMEDIRKALTEGVRQTHLAKKYGCSTAKLSNFIKRNNLKDPDAKAPTPVPKVFSDDILDPHTATIKQELKANVTQAALAKKYSVSCPRMSAFIREKNLKDLPPKKPLVEEPIPNPEIPEVKSSELPVHPV